MICESCITGSPNTKFLSANAAAVGQDSRSSAARELTSSPTRATAHQHSQNGTGSVRGHGYSTDIDAGPYDPNGCAGCREQLKEGQALIALDRQWHISCFCCKNCKVVLNGEYMGKDGVPYCEKCYQKLFGVKCAYCNRYISGKVLQAGDNHHFHPTCARCTKCGDPFGDGEEMYLQGSAVWHPRCGPCPNADVATILNGTGVGSTAGNGHLTDTDCDRLSQSAASELQVFSLYHT